MAGDTLSSTVSVTACGRVRLEASSSDLDVSLPAAVRPTPRTNSAAPSSLCGSGPDQTLRSGLLGNGGLAVPFPTFEPDLKNQFGAATRLALLRPVSVLDQKASATRLQYSGFHQEV